MRDSDIVSTSSKYSTNNNNSSGKGASQIKLLRLWARQKGYYSSFKMWRNHKHGYGGGKLVPLMKCLVHKQIIKSVWVTSWDVDFMLMFTMRWNVIGRWYKSVCDYIHCEINTVRDIWRPEARFGRDICSSLMLCLRCDGNHKECSKWSGFVCRLWLIYYCLDMNTSWRQYI